MKSEEFIEASSYLRVLEKRILTSESVSRAADASGALEMLRLLSQNSDYDFSSLKRTEDYESVLKDKLAETYGLLYKISPYREIVDIHAAKYDLHNVKVALKSKYLNKVSDHLYFTVTGLRVSELESLVSKGEKRDGLPEYVKTAVSNGEKAYGDSLDPQAIDIACDKSMFAYMLSLCEKIHNNFITEYVKISIDLCNIKTIVRIKNMQKGTVFLRESLIPGGLTDIDFFIGNYDKPPEVLANRFYLKHFGDAAIKGFDEFTKTGNYGGLEKFLDNFLIRHIRTTKFIAYGPEVLFSYIAARENEIRQIRLLVTCKKNGVETEQLKERLRDNFI